MNVKIDAQPEANHILSNEHRWRESMLMCGVKLVGRKMIKFLMQMLGL